MDPKTSAITVSECVAIGTLKATDSGVIGSEVVASGVVALGVVGCYKDVSPTTTSGPQVPIRYLCIQASQH